MTFAEVVYSPILRLLDILFSKIESLADDKESDALDNMYFELKDMIAKLNGCRGGDNVRSLSNLTLFLDKPDYTPILTDLISGEFDRLHALATLGKILEADSLDFNDVPKLAPTDFKLIPDTYSQLPCRAFGYENPVNPKDSIAYIDFSDSAWPQEIGVSGITNGILAVFIELIATSSAFELSRVIAVRSSATPSPAMAALRMQIVAHGKTVHIPIISTLKPSLVAIDKFSADQALHQFNELILILSEYNSRQDLLTKFLSLYHVIESFMYKVPLVEMSVAAGNKMFSIRDFKRIYNNLHDNEAKSLKALMEILWSTRVNTKELSSLVTKAGTSCISNLQISEADEYLRKIGIFENNGAKQLKGLTATSFTKLLYHTRNAIVHNGDTEFHISHHSLNESVRVIIEEVIMEPLESVLFTVMADHNSKVWYKGESLQLYANS